jgi:hypothetical protein
LFLLLLALLNDLCSALLFLFLTADARELGQHFNYAEKCPRHDSHKKTKSVHTLVQSLHTDYEKSCLTISPLKVCDFHTEIEKMAEMGKIDYGTPVINLTFSNKNLRYGLEIMSYVVVEPNRRC